MMDARNHVLEIIRLITHPDGGLKTAAHYEHVLKGYIRDLYDTGNEGFYLDRHSRLIEQQFERAWRAGLKEAGVPWEDMTDEELSALTKAIRDEQDRTLDFAEEILEAREAGISPARFYARAALWANRYNQMQGQALAMAGPNKNLEWVLGMTERHCRSCLKLAGRVKRASYWQSSVMPQGAPNPLLECGGWQCDCRLVITDKPCSKGPLPRLP